MAPAMMSMRTAFTAVGIVAICSLLIRFRLERPQVRPHNEVPLKHVRAMSSKSTPSIPKYNYIHKYDIYKASKNESYIVCRRLPEILDDILEEEADMKSTKKKYQGMLDRGEMHCGNERVYGTAWIFAFRQPLLASLCGSISRPCCYPPLAGKYWE